MRIKVITKGGKSWTGTPANVVKQMSTMDHAGARDHKEYMRNVKRRLASIGMDIEFTTPYRFLLALAAEGLLIVTKGNGDKKEPA